MTPSILCANADQYLSTNLFRFLLKLLRNAGMYYIAYVTAQRGGTWSILVFVYTLHISCESEGILTMMRPHV